MELKSIINTSKNNLIPFSYRRRTKDEVINRQVFRGILTLLAAMAFMISFSPGSFGQGMTKDTSVGKSGTTYTVSGKLTHCKTEDVVITGDVTLLAKGGQVVSEAWTDQNGLYTLSWVPAGDYTLNFARDGKQSQLAVSVSKDMTDQNACIDNITPSLPIIDPATAQSDINSGTVQIYICDAGAPLTQADLNKISSKYGFKYTMKGVCLLDKADKDAFDAYNLTVMNYLDTKNPSGWRTKLGTDLDALIATLAKESQGQGGEEFNLQ